MLCSLLICVVTAHVLLYYVSQLSKHVPYELWVVGNTRESTVSRRQERWRGLRYAVIGARTTASIWLGVL